jgi:hypothetical protein
VKTIAFVMVFGVLAACTKDNPHHCQGDRCAVDAAVDGPTACSTSAQCMAPTAVCDTSAGTCVQCIAGAEEDACTGTTPVCGDNHACRGCTAHAECPSSQACLPDGSCADASQVAYVDPGGTDNDQCTQGMKCTLLSKALMTTRPYVKMTGTTNDQVTINNQTVTILADPGAKLTSTSNGILLQVQGSSVVKIYDLEVTGASGATSFGISMPAGNTATLSLHRVTVSGNTGGGISATGGTLTVSQSTVSGNTGGGISATGGTLTVSQSTVSGNTGGGISISGAQFDLTNNMIVKNGSANSAFGGVLVSQITSGAGRFDFNTVSGNSGDSGTVTGVLCSVVTQAITFSNNIVYANQVSGGGTQVGGNNCNWTYSNIGPGDDVPGTGNKNEAPLFVNPGQNNFHIMASSPARNTADPAATLNVDFDGDERPEGGVHDMGADEYVP